MANAIIALVGAGFQAYEANEAGKEAKRQADQAADAIRKEDAQLASLTADKLHDIERDKSFEKGEAKAYGALGGSKVGTGSGRSLLNRIEGAARRKSELVTKGTGPQRAAFLAEASEYERRGRNKRSAGKRYAFASLLAGAAKAGKGFSKWGGGGSTWNQQKAAMDQPDYYG